VAEDFDAVADELYGVPRDEFTAARNAAAKRVKQQGDRELAERISGLRRPSTAAWLANLLAREHPDEVRALVELGDGLRAAQDQLHGDALRHLSRQRHEVVHGLVQQAKGLARGAGHPASESVGRELEDTFTAAVNSSSAASALAQGRLTTALDPSDSDQAPEPTSAPPRPRPEPEDRTEQLRRDLEAAQADATEAAAARDASQQAAGDAEQAAENATGAVRELRERIEGAERDEREARKRVRAAQHEADTADRRAREAQRRVRDLERRLAKR
jgi:hypothetical protein